MQEPDQYIEDVQKRVAIYNFVQNLSNEEFWKLEKELEDDDDDNSKEMMMNSLADDDNSKKNWELMDLNRTVDVAKRVELFEHILDCMSTRLKYSDFLIGMKGMSKKAGLSYEFENILADIHWFTKFKENLFKSEGNRSSVIKNPTYIHKSSPPDGYVMTRIPRGTCLIINNTFDYDRDWNRKGTNFDKGRLKRLFKWLHFEVDVRNDINADEISELFNNLENNILEDSDCFVCCLLTHGTDSDIYGNDKKPVSRKLLWKSVEADSCKKLANKPKIFFMQACRKAFFEETRVTEDSPQTEMADRKRANQADICMVVATTEGDCGYRDKNLGSFFIQTLCEVFEKHADEASLMEMLTETNKQLSDKKIHLDFDDRNYQVLDSKMMTLPKPLYFKPQKKFKGLCKIANIGV